MRPRGQTAKATDLDSVMCEFESHRGHQLKIEEIYVIKVWCLFYSWGNGVMEAMSALEAFAARRGGSSPSSPTNFYNLLGDEKWDALMDQNVLSNP